MKAEVYDKPAEDMAFEACPDCDTSGIKSFGCLKQPCITCWGLGLVPHRCSDG